MRGVGSDIVSDVFNSFHIYIYIYYPWLFLLLVPSHIFYDLLDQIRYHQTSTHQNPS